MNPKQNVWAVETPRSLGVALRNYRKEAGLTQQELGTQLGVSRKLVERVENGDTSEQVRVILAAFRILGIRLQAVSRDD